MYLNFCNLSRELSIDPYSKLLVIFFLKEILKVNFELVHFNLQFFPIFYDRDIGHPISYKVPWYLVLNCPILIEVPMYPKMGRPLWTFPKSNYIHTVHLVFDCGSK